MMGREQSRRFVAGLLTAMLVVVASLGFGAAPRADAQAPLTATPATTNIFRIANEITYPRTGDAVSGWVSIRGTAVIDNFRQYQLHISPAGMESWRWLYSSARVVRDGQLYLQDSTLLADGFYDLRLRAVRDDGQFSEAFMRRLEIRNAHPPTPTPEFDDLGTPLPPTPTPTATFTPTPTPDVRVRALNGQGFHAPMPGALLRGYVPIVATVNGTDREHFARYELYLSPAGAEAWSWLYTSATQLWQETVYVLDSFGLADGAYDLRLRVVYRDSNFSEYHLRNLLVANRSAPTGGQTTTRPTAATISAPLAISVPLGQTTVPTRLDVWGTAADPNFLRWELHWAPSESGWWSFLAQGDRQVVQSLLARLDLSGVPPGRYDLRLRVVRQDGNYSDFLVRGLVVVGRGGA